MQGKLCKAIWMAPFENYFTAYMHIFIYMRTTFPASKLSCHVQQRSQSFQLDWQDFPITGGPVFNFMIFLFRLPVATFTFLKYISSACAAVFLL